MGNSMVCFSPDKEMMSLPRQTSKKPPFPKRLTKKQRQKDHHHHENHDHDHDHHESLTGDQEDLVLKQQALAAALMFREFQKNGNTAPYMSRSASVVYPPPAQKKQHAAFPRSSSTSRQRFGSDTSVLQPRELVTSQDPKSIEGLETNHFILVHGGGFGAWCWYKTMTLLLEGGFRVDAVDLTGSGVHSSDTNSITSLAQYVKPLTDILEKLEDGKKVILVGHDFGGACISYVMELFPTRIAKAIFVSATMLASGQSTLDLFSRQIGPNDLMQQAQTFLFANGKDHPPTAIDYNKESVKDLFFNQSPSKDVALASVSMRPIPFAPVMEKLSLSDANYGSVRRFYVVTSEDQAITADLQDTMIDANPPEQVFRVKGSDHSPFFSRPQALHKVFVEIAQMPQK